MPVQDSDEDEEDNFLPANATREEFYAFRQKEFAKAAKNKKKKNVKSVSSADTIGRERKSL